MSDDYSDMSDFTFKTPAGLVELGKCGCGGMVYGRLQGDQKRYLQTETGRYIKLCAVCDEKENPPESMKNLERVSRLAEQEIQLRKEYEIPCHCGVREWMIENNGKKVRINGEFVTVSNAYY